MLKSGESIADLPPEMTDGAGSNHWRFGKRNIKEVYSAFFREYKNRIIKSPNSGDFMIQAASDLFCK
jgi:hypothetical protein